MAVEGLCFLRAMLIPLLIVLGVNHWSRIPMLYALALATVFLNQMRLLADHHLHGDGSRVDFESHIIDSCNYTSNDPLTLLFFPFSIRYHAAPSFSIVALSQSQEGTRPLGRHAAEGLPLFVARSTGLVERCPPDALRTSRLF